eukprot:TRINITY_DN4585_c0_g1_i2.p2 TRINITY_DN4585_c0_g1~~TRINITY_DN4585_c0_g1_i2.p2  ORF type:complete len:101 (+),score=19.79 TRINITY_DN4585_c0_g1_i2:91-393(+)
MKDFGAIGRHYNHLRRGYLRYGTASCLGQRVLSGETGADDDELARLQETKRADAKKNRKRGIPDDGHAPGVLVMPGPKRQRFLGCLPRMPITTADISTDV